MTGGICCSGGAGDIATSGEEVVVNSVDAGPHDGRESVAVTRLRLLLAGASLVGTGVVLTGVPAAVGAADPLRVEGTVEAVALAPGHARESRLTVTNDTGAPVRLDLRVTGLVGSEGSCLPSEVRVEGEECGADGGELARDLEVRVLDGAQVLYDGSLTGLLDGVTLDERVETGSVDLDVVVGLPDSSPNDTMTDALTFRTELMATGATGPTEVAGVETTVTAQQPGHPGAAVPTAVDAGLRVTLPGVGGTVSVWPLLVSALALLALPVVWLRVRRRRAAT